MSWFKAREAPAFFNGHAFTSGHCVLLLLCEGSRLVLIQLCMLGLIVKEESTGLFAIEHSSSPQQMCLVLLPNTNVYL